MKINFDNPNKEEIKQQVEQVITEYIENYHWSVIPVGNDKRPLLSWKKYQKERLFTYSQFEEVIEKNRLRSKGLGGVAVITGEISNLVVVDIDFKNGAVDPLTEYKKKTPTVRTGSGGLHYYFKYVEGVGNSAGIMQGVDIRGQGGYVVAPPSNHPSGTRYEWITTPQEVDIQPLPAFILEAINRVEVVQKDALRSFEVPSIGNRNNTLAQFIGDLLPRFSQDDWDSKVWSLILAFNDQFNPPLALEEVERTYKSIKGAELRSHFKIDSEQVQKSEDDIDDVLEGVLDTSRTMGLSTGIKALDRTIGGIRKKTNIMLVADTNMGKSMLLLNILINMAKLHGTKSVIFDLENGRDEVYQRLLQIWLQQTTEFVQDRKNIEHVKGAMNELRKYIKVYHHQQLHDLGLDEKGAGHNLILSLIDQHVKEGYEVFMVDPLQELEISLSSNQLYQEQGKIVRDFKNKAVAEHVTIMICHHTRKGGNSRSKEVENQEDLNNVKVKYYLPTGDDASGSKKIRNATTDMWAFMRFAFDPHPTKRSICTMSVEKTRSKYRGRVGLYFDENTFVFHDNPLVLTTAKPNLYNSTRKHVEKVKQEETEDLIEFLSEPF